MTRVKIERCAVLVPPPLASSVHEWDKTTRITDYAGAKYRDAHNLQ